MKKIQGSLYVSLILMTWIPLIGFTLIMCIFGAKTLKMGMEEEVEEALKNLSISIVDTFDRAYPGDYGVNEEGYVVKGDTILYDDFSIIDRIKEETGVDVTLFYGNTRVLTTILDREEQRINGTYAADIITEQVIKKQKPYFSKELSIYGQRYYAYYVPLRNKDDTVQGMLFVGKEQAQVQRKVDRVVGQILFIALIALLLAGLLSIYFTTSIVDAIKKMMEFLRKVSNGDLSAKQNQKLLERNDEIGEMGRLTVTVQRSLRNLIERDGLTGLYNRRSGEVKLKELKAKADSTGDIFSVALGDIDFFKTFNDQHGHECGDVVLKKVAECLQEYFTSQKGYAIRWGGEEFLLVFMGIAKKEVTVEAGKILDSINHMQIEYDDLKVSVAMTFGVAQYHNGEDIEKLVKRADDRLYEGKKSGRNQVVE